VSASTGRTSRSTTGIEREGPPPSAPKSFRRGDLRIGEKTQRRAIWSLADVAPPGDIPMPMRPDYCARCGKALVTRVADGRPRAVCPECETIFYDNPLPVAASVVLSAHREVLLVKRKRAPHKGEWCLPMGFAETGETIAAAALRELKEETGIEAQVLRLLDVDSLESSHYGDLLIVTFEMQKVGGIEEAGDDAEEVRYFPIAAPPALAFRSNEKALRVCAAAHQESWAIQDSFGALHSEEDETMLSDALVLLIQERADEVAQLWLTDVRTSPTTPSYRKVAPDQLKERAVLAMSQFGRWLKGAVTQDDVKAFYRILAHERRLQGFEVHELLSSLALLKKHVWAFAHSQGVWEQPIDIYRVLELNRRTAVFFDRAMYHAAREFSSRSPA
jgi:8-oxo-dGTP diphosphatase